MLTKRGSVGKSTLKFIPGINSCNGTEKGTRKTESIKTLSRAKNNAKNTIIAKGTRLKKKFSCFIIKNEFVIINRKAIT